VVCPRGWLCVMGMESVGIRRRGTLVLAASHASPLGSATLTKVEDSVLLRSLFLQVIQQGWFRHKKKNHDVAAKNASVELD
jgi:hypothetical protein